MGENLIRTWFEKIMCQALTDLGIQYYIYNVYCFKCKGFFEWTKYNIPRCHIGNHPLEAKQFARPDIIITSDNGGPRKVGVIRIDGGIHKKKRINNKDFWQVQSFWQCGVRVFIVKNDDIDPRYNPVFQTHALALLFKRLLDEPELYDRIYLNSKYMKEHVRKI